MDRVVGEHVDGSGTSLHREERVDFEELGREAATRKPDSLAPVSRAIPPPPPITARPRRSMLHNPWSIGLGAAVLGAVLTILTTLTTRRNDDPPERTMAAAAPITVASRPALDPVPPAPTAAEPALPEPPEAGAVVTTPPSAPPVEQEASSALRQAPAQAKRDRVGGAAQPRLETTQSPPAPVTGAGTPIEPQTADAEEPLAMDLPERPSRAQIGTVLSSATSAVRRCGDRRHGLTTVRVTVSSSGRVRHALVGGSLAGTTEGSCVARAMRTLRFPRFTEPTLVVEYPYQL